MDYSSWSYLLISYQWPTSLGQYVELGLRMKVKSTLS